MHHHHSYSIAQSRAEQSRAEQSRAEQSRAEQSRAEQSRAEQSRAEQSRGTQLPTYLITSKNTIREIMLEYFLYTVNYLRTNDGE